MSLVGWRMVSVISQIVSAGPTFFEDLCKFVAPMLSLGCRNAFLFSVANMNENGPGLHMGSETTSGNPRWHIFLFGCYLVFGQLLWSLCSIHKAQIPPTNCSVNVCL